MKEIQGRTLAEAGEFLADWVLQSGYELSAIGRWLVEEPSEKQATAGRNGRELGRDLLPMPWRRGCVEQRLALRWCALITDRILLRERVAPLPSRADGKIVLLHFGYRLTHQLMVVRE